MVQDDQVSDPSLSTETASTLVNGTDADEPFKISMLSQNMYLPAITGVARDTFTRSKRLDSFLQALEKSVTLATTPKEHQFDVILFQELFLCPAFDVIGFGQICKKLRNKVLDALPKLGYPYVVAAPKPSNPLKHNSGLAIASKYPLSNVEHKVFSTMKGSESWLAEKGILMADLTLPNGKVVSLLNTHLDSQVAVARAEQTVELEMWASERKGALIAGGDFNAEVPDLELSDASCKAAKVTPANGKCWLNAYDAYYPKDQRPVTWEDQKKRVCLDHFFIRQSLVSSQSPSEQTRVAQPVPGGVDRWKFDSDKDGADQIHIDMVASDHRGISSSFVIA
jgi:endonuclease/exonuclease/phosphatase family metal-dependent hydrolase